MTSDATVFIVDDEEGVRDSLQRLIQSVDIRTEAYASAPDFLAAYHPDKWGCLLLDIRMPGMSGLELQRKLAAQRITLPVLIITGYGDVSSAVSAMKTGAFEFIEKPFNRQILLEKIQRAIESHRQHRETNAKRASITARMATLTPREIEVMRRVVSGQANKVIAFDLGISKKTVEAHRARVMEKMNVRTVAELVRANVLFEETTTGNSGNEEFQQTK